MKTVIALRLTTILTLGTCESLDTECTPLFATNGDGAGNDSRDGAASSSSSSGGVPVCGDGEVDADELCDDGNLNDGDACSAVCESTKIVQISAGDYNVCVLFASGRLRCWGYNYSGQVGNGDTENIGDSPNELPVPDLEIAGKVVQVAVGGSFVCALVEPGDVRCWGYGEAGYLGYENTESLKEPPEISVDVGAPVVELAAGAMHACAIVEDQSIRCWGANYWAMLGNGSSLGAHVGDEPGDMPPKALPELVDVDHLSAGGGWHTCALVNGAVHCWGSSESPGALGQGTPEAYGANEGETTPPAVKLGLPAKSVVVGGNQTCAILDDDSVRCWGWTGQGSIGDEPGEIEALPAMTLAEDGETVIQLAAGWEHTCALLDSGKVRCWGYNFFGQLGLGTKQDVYPELDELPSAAILDGKAKQIAAGGNFTCALMENDKLRCWGRNDDGELGLGHTKDIGDDETPASAPSVPY